MLRSSAAPLPRFDFRVGGRVTYSPEPMSLPAKLLVACIAIEHLAFLVLEMFLWTTPIGMKAFALTPEFAQQSAPLAANQGLYNGFLAAGLILALVREKEARVLAYFFLGCISVAGVFGAATAKPSILFIQAAPAVIALILIRFTSPRDLTSSATIR